jgi:hypothetical protein
MLGYKDISKCSLLGIMRVDYIVGHSINANPLLITGHRFTIRTMTLSWSLLAGHKSKDLYRRKFFHLRTNPLGFHKIKLSTKALQIYYIHPSSP